LKYIFCHWIFLAFRISMSGSPDYLKYGMGYSRRGTWNSTLSTRICSPWDLQYMNQLYGDFSCVLIVSVSYLAIVCHLKSIFLSTSFMEMLMRFLQPPSVFSPELGRHMDLLLGEYEFSIPYLVWPLLLLSLILL